MQSVDILEEAKRVFNVEAEAISGLSKRLGSEFLSAVEVLKGCNGKVIVTGMGKSGLIGRKIAATLSSTGTPAIFLHPAESSHGDLGVVSTNDSIIAISYGGEAAELDALIQFTSRKNIPLIALTGKVESTLGQAAKVVIDIGIESEACPLGLAPTTSTAVTLAMGDALAVSLMKTKGIKEEDFAEFHPGGKLGRRLLTRVKDVMHAHESLPLVAEDALMKDVIAKMTAREVQGVAGVVDAEGFLIGVVTDGDLRRSLESSQNPLEVKVSSLMSQQPKTIDENELAEKALFVMEQFQIQTLFAIEKVKVEGGSVKPKPVGLLHIQDLLKAKIR